MKDFNEFALRIKTISNNALDYIEKYGELRHYESYATAKSLSWAVKTTNDTIGMYLQFDNSNYHLMQFVQRFTGDTQQEQNEIDDLIFKEEKYANTVKKYL